MLKSDLISLMSFLPCNYQPLHFKERCIFYSQILYGDSVRSFLALLDK